MKKQETDSIFEVATSVEDQEKMRSEGVSEDEIPPVGVRRYRRSRFHAKPGESKVKISLYIDGDILEYFRQRAKPPHAAPYQTQINNELRRVMENGSKENASLENDILNNEAFLRALKEKLATV